MTGDEILSDDPFGFDPAAALAMIDRYDAQGIAVVRLEWSGSGEGVAAPGPAHFAAPGAETWREFRIAANESARAQVQTRAQDSTARVALVVIHKEEWRPFRIQ